MDGSSSSGGFSQIPSGGLNSRPASGGYNDSEQSGGGGGAGVGGQRDPHVKINQIVQAFFWKAAMIIIERRIPTTLYTSSRTGEKMVNRWFNIELDEIDTLKKDCEYWRHTDAYSHPKPMIVEVYLDTSELSATQALVILDSRGSRWNVNEALESAASRAGLNMSYKGGPIVLERWKIALSPPHDINPNMEAPSVYKQAIILFRTLWSYINLMPVWKFKKKLAKTVLHSSILKLGIRIMDSDEHAEASRRWDGLRVPLFPGESNQVTEEHAFEKVESPAGNMNISVSFRRNCDFKVDESEALLSSQFINLDEHYFRPTRHQRTASQPTNFPPPPRLSGEAGSLPAHLASRESPHSNPQNHYGSLSSFHNYNTGTSASPLSQLRGIDMHRAASSNGSPASAMRSVNGSNSSLPRGATGTDPKPADRRASISSSFQPFKAPSLSSSPAPGTDYAPARMGTPASLRSRGGIGGISGTSYGVTGSGTSYTAGGAYKSSTPDNQSGIPIGSQPMTRIASSFGSRRPRNISTSAREADDNNSSGGASYSSSMAAPGSGLYSNPNNSNPYTAGSGGGANPLSFEEDLEITAFLNLMADGQKTQLKSFGPAAAKNRQTELDSLSKFREMRDSQAVLADSMNSSVLLQQQQPAGSVGSGAGGSSLGKTPHTPIIPSRLSNHT
ncbi:autophagy-related protein 13-domain-containing protein, partial [Pyronema omphalodes]